MRDYPKKRSPLAYLILFLFSFSLLQSCSLSLLLQSLPDEIQIELDNIANYGFDGVIVNVNRGTDSASYAGGWNNRENGIPADPHSLFKIASISKLYIAAAASKLIDRGVLSLETPLSDMLPDIAGRIEYSDQITLKMMLRHRSGIPDLLDNPDFPWNDLPKTTLDALEYALDKSAKFKPDRWYQYSNTNYLLIGEILDKTLTYSHHRFIDEEILDPLGLTNTYNVLKEVNPDDVMSGYFVGYEPDIKGNHYIIPGGSMVASAEDVGIFLKALIDGSLLTETEQAIYSSVYVYEHTGLLPGYQSITRYYEDIDSVVTVFVNTSGGDSWSKIEILNNRVLRILRK